MCGPAAVARASWLLMERLMTLARTRSVCVALGLAAVAGSLMLAQPAAAQKTLKFVPEADLRSLDPIWTTAYITRNHGYMVYDTLFALDEHFKPQPQMVDHWK